MTAKSKPYYLFKNSDIESIAKALENAIFRAKKRQFSYDSDYTPVKVEIPLKCLKTALKRHKL